jgi:chromate transporter
MQDVSESEAVSLQPAQLPTSREALRFWAWLGCVSFGGPAGQIAIMHEEVVERKRWVDERHFSHALNYCMVLPGPEAQQLATYLGWLLHGVRGGVAAGLLFILPGFLLLLGLSAISALGGEIAWVRAIFRGFEPAVVAVIFVATWRMAKRGLRSSVAWLLAGGAFVALTFQIPFAAILVVAAVVGWLAKLHPAAGHDTSSHSKDGVTVTQTEPHAERPVTRRGTLQMLVVFALLWGAAYGLLVAVRGYDSVPGQMALFFSKSALLTFGGAYAVLPYVSECAVQANWITPDQVVSGLALGETTPGPLILVLTYFGFMGGFRSAATNPLAEGIFCGTIATYFTFLPSFAFILIGAPWIERLRKWDWLSGVMAGISAAVVGVILHLGVTVLYRVWWPKALTLRPLWWEPEAFGPIDGYAVAMSLLAGVALLRYRLSVPRVVLAAGVIGLVRWYLVGPAFLEL